MPLRLLSVVNFVLMGLGHREEEYVLTKEMFPEFIAPAGILQDPIKGTQVSFNDKHTQQNCCVGKQTPRAVLQTVWPPSALQ